MKPIKALLVLALIVVVVSAGPPGAAAGAKGRPPAANGVEPFGSPEWPTVAAKLAQSIARASFAHKYGRVWGFLDPLDRRAVSESRWLRCQGSHPVAPPTVAITQVSVASATELPVDLSLLGRRNVQEIELVVQYRTAGVSGPQLATLSTFWLEQKNAWSAVWLSDEYRAYSAGRCYLSPQGPPLY